MTANPTTFYVPENRDLYEETAAEILIGAKTYHTLSKEKQTELKKEFSERVLRYFDKLDIAPSLDNILLHQEELRKEISYEIEEEMQTEEEYEDILGLGKKAKAKREAKKSNSNSDTFNTGGNWSKKPDAGSGDYRNANASNGTKILKKPDAGSGNYNNANASNGTKNEKWNEMLKNGFGVVTQAAQVAQTIKQNNQQTTTEQQQGFFPDPEPKKQKVLGMEPIVGIALILIIVVVFAFLIWQISQNKSK